MLDMLLEEMAVEKVAGVDKQAALAMLDEMSDHQLVATYETVVPAEEREKASFVIPGIKRVTTGGLAQKARAALKSSLKVKKVKMAAKANAAVAVPPPKVKPLSKAGKGFTAPKVSKSALSPYPDAAPKLTWA